MKTRYNKVGLSKSPQQGGSITYNPLSQSGRLPAIRFSNALINTLPIRPKDVRTLIQLPIIRRLSMTS